MKEKMSASPQRGLANREITLKKYSHLSALLAHGQDAQALHQRITNTHRVKPGVWHSAGYFLGTQLESSQVKKTHTNPCFFCLFVFKSTRKRKGNCRGVNSLFCKPSIPWENTCGAGTTPQHIRSSPSSPAHTALESPRLPALPSSHTPQRTAGTKVRDPVTAPGRGEGPSLAGQTQTSKTLTYSKEVCRGLDLS